VQTVDFFTPIVDDFYDFGRIAAANSLSDVYTMGGRPVTALNIACFPALGDPDWLAAILNGGIDHAATAGVAVLGGHSVDDPEIKYGLSVTGTVHPKKIIHDHTAQAGDVLVLTKAVGTGILSTALKRGLLDAAQIKYLTEHMLALNKIASETMVSLGAHAATDITGFGLLGHAYEMASASNVSFRIFSDSVPLLDQVLHFVEKGCVPAGNRNNWDYVKEYVGMEAEVETMRLKVLHDPQTSGGLLVSLSQTAAKEYVKCLTDQGILGAIIGEVIPSGDKTLLLAK
jgi:selenide,water dikinase